MSGPGSGLGHLLMPKLGLTMEEGKVAKWQVRPGEPFAAGDILVVVETDKIANDVEAPSAGVIDEVLVPEGEVVPVSAPIARWRLHEASPQAAIPHPAAPAASQPQPAAQSAPPAQTPQHDGPRRLATPYARRLAREAGIDLDDVRGTGPRGRIKAADVIAAQTKRPSAVATRDERAHEPDILAPQAAASIRTLSLAQIEVATAGLGDIVRRFPQEQRQAVRLALVGMACAQAFPGSSIGIELDNRIVPLAPEGSLRTRAAQLLGREGVEMASGGAVLVVPGGDATLFAPAAPSGWPAALGLAAEREVLARAAAGEIIAAQVMTLSLSYDSAAIGNAGATALLSTLKSQLEDPLVLLAG